MVNKNQEFFKLLKYSQQLEKEGKHYPVFVNPIIANFYVILRKHTGN